MGECRERADIWYWLGLRWNFPEFVKRKIWKSEYFWHDSFGRYWNRIIGCRLFGHRSVINVSDSNEEKRIHCFYCERDI